MDRRAWEARFPFGEPAVERATAAVLERIFPDAAGQVAYHYVLVDYLCEYLEGELTPGSDITAAQFVTWPALSRFDLPHFTLHVLQRAEEQMWQGSYLPVIM